MILVPSNKCREDGPACDNASQVAGEWWGDWYPLVPLPLKFKSRSSEAYRPSG
jgi:hypothetical protein